MKNYIERYWRKATKEDSVREPMMVARFRDSSSEEWKIRKLLRWDRGEDPWISDFGHSYPECEVYDAPDPGEGYELIDPMAECPGPGFEFLYGQHWHPAGEKVLEWDTFYRRKIQPEAKPEAAEPVTFVVHPIQFNDKGECLFYGKVIQERSYAVLNEQGHYLMWRLGVGPVYVPEFRQAFTPAQLLQVSIRELGRNIRLRAVEPVDVDKLKQEIRQELQPKSVEPTPTYEPGKVYEHNGRKFRLAVKGEEGYAVFGSNIGLPDALQGVARRLISVRADNFKRYQLGTGLHFQYAFVEIHEPKQPPQPEYAPF